MNQYKLIVVLLVHAVACASEAECDPDQTLVDGVCIPNAIDSGVADAGSSSDSGAVAGDGGGPDFGSPCTDSAGHTDCADPAPYCAVMPGAAEGVCTRDGCLDSPEVCPTGWNCVDLSRFMPGLPSICIEQ